MRAHAQSLRALTLPSLFPAAVQAIRVSCNASRIARMRALWHAICLH